MTKYLLLLDTMVAVTKAGGGLFMLAALSTPALAQWVHDEDAGGIFDANAFALDRTGEYELHLTCDFATGEELLLVTPLHWDDQTSYADEVPVTITVDGVDLQPLIFSFVEENAKEAIWTDYLFEPVVKETLPMLATAREDITISYFDTTASFSATGAQEAITYIATFCAD